MWNIADYVRFMWNIANTSDKTETGHEEGIWEKSKQASFHLVANQY